MFIFLLHRVLCGIERLGVMDNTEYQGPSINMRKSRITMCCSYLWCGGNCDLPGGCKGTVGYGEHMVGMVNTWWWVWGTHGGGYGEHMVVGMGNT